MPIHTSWKSMAKAMVANAKYCKKDTTRRCYKFTDGKKVCGCAGGWSVFFATVKTMGAKPEKPRPKTQESKQKILKWFMESHSSLMSSDLPAHSIPNWIGLAKKVIESPKFNEKIKTFWRKRMGKWCKDNPNSDICKKKKVNK